MPHPALEAGSLHKGAPYLGHVVSGRSRVPNRTARVVAIVLAHSSSVWCIRSEDRSLGMRGHSAVFSLILVALVSVVPPCTGIMGEPTRTTALERDTVAWHSVLQRDS